MSLINTGLIDFSVWGFHDNDFKQYTQAELLGKWSVLFFYPADFTFVCPTELSDLADHYDEFKAIDCEIYSISQDTHFVHKAWADTSDRIKKIKYPMLADPAAVLSRHYEVLVEENFQSLRGTFILNPRGEVKAYEVHDMGIGRNVLELLRKVQAAQFVDAHGDQVCPANWKPGAETLKPSLDLVGIL